MNDQLPNFLKPGNDSDASRIRPNGDYLLRHYFFLGLCIVSMACRVFEGDPRLERLELRDDKVVRFGVIGPQNNFSGVAHPLVICLPTGFQEIRDVLRTLDLLWANSECSQDSIIVCPAAGPGFPYSLHSQGIFGQGPERLIPYILDHLIREYPVEQSEIHLVQLGWDGSGALKIALDNPDVFRSVTLLPNLAPDYDLLSVLSADEGVRINVLASSSNPAEIEFELESRNIARAVHLRRIRAPSELEAGYDAFVESMPEICKVIEESIDTIGTRPENP